MTFGWPCVRSLSSISWSLAAITFGSSPATPSIFMDDLYAGIRLACQQYNVDIVGGDTTSSLTGLAISITCIGDADKDKVVYRNGAKETDLICVSGDLGAAYMGLQLLEREKVVLKGEKDVQPDFSGKEYLLERQLKPEARKDIIEKLAAANIIPTLCQ